MIFNPNNWFHIFFVIPILNILMGFYNLLAFIHIPYPLGFSLIFLTVGIRLALNPMMVNQIKSTKKLNELKPQLDKLNEKFKNDKTQLHQEQLKLYQQAGINPAAGCLPLLLQMPILIALYNLFFQILNSSKAAQVVGEINKVVYFSFLKVSSLDLSFFGINLAIRPSEWQSKGVLLLAVPIITAVLQYWQTKLMTPQTTSSLPAKQEKRRGIKDRNSGENKDKAGKGKEQQEDMGQAMQKQMAIMMPLMIGFFAYSFPLGLSIYWNTFTLFGIIQQYKIAQQDL